ncbi:tripartite motif-containing protein 16-like isoform X2 [Neolamprologus brichardi]|uniref:tripartite motif-containing protein 16-like isoform X2 n=1 Tax=Neolamprologus brichardi TaxID=32507 RepID=UPI001643921A|nr:tripartite motif-containing protein 16-like isoform X2 [Neolamprologus brichardi]
MAQQGSKSVKFHCSVCRDLLKEPVTIPCGHNYCRKSFISRPDLEKNSMLEGLGEDLKTSGHQAASADLCYAGPEDVSCDVCTEKKQKAVKSCLVCLVSYCEKHLQPHHDSSAFDKHKLVKPSNRLKGNICSTHNEVMKTFCRTDQQCICYVCCMDKHKRHVTVPVEVERAEKDKDLKMNLQEVQKKIQTRVEEGKVLEKEMEGIKLSADKTIEDSDAIINELVSYIKEKGSNLKQQIKSQQETEESRVKELQNNLEQEITELRRKEEELKQLSDTEGHTEFLLSYSMMSKLSENTDSPSFKMCQVKYFEDLQTAVLEARENLKAFLSEEWRKITLTVRSVDVLLPQIEPKIRDDFLKHSCQLTMDPDTVHKNLFLSNQNRTVSDSAPNPNIYPAYKTRDRFSIQQQVLSKESLIGPCYWEVEMKGKGLSVAVTYKNKNKLDQSEFGSNNNSWRLDCYKDSYKFRHNKITTPLSGPLSSKVGVYVDPRAGVLSFYSVSDTMALLHRVQTTFTEPLYAGLWIWKSYWAENTATFNEIK